MRFIERNRQPLITNLPVVTEVVYVLDFSGEAQRDFLSWAQPALTIDTGTVDDLPRIRAILEKYADLQADFADASLVALCDRIKIWDVASVDSDFTIYRGHDKRRFNNQFSRHENRRGNAALLATIPRAAPPKTITGAPPTGAPAIPAPPRRPGGCSVTATTLQIRLRLYGRIERQRRPGG